MCTFYCSYFFKNDNFTLHFKLKIDYKINNILKTINQNKNYLNTKTKRKLKPKSSSTQTHHLCPLPSPANLPLLRSGNLRPNLAISTKSPPKSFSISDQAFESQGFVLRQQPNPPRRPPQPRPPQQGLHRCRVLKARP